MSLSHRRSLTAICVLAASAGAAYLFIQGSEHGAKKQAPPNDGPEPTPSFAASQPDLTAPASTSRSSNGEGPVLNRQRADQIRELLHKATLSASPTPSPSTNTTARAEAEKSHDYPEMPTGANPDGGDALRQYIRSVVRDDYFPLAKQCYEARLATNPKLKLHGRVEMNFEILGDKKIGGVVDTAEYDDETTTIIDREFRTCLRESMLSVSFDAPPGGKVTVKYPIEFSDEDPEEDAGR